MRILTVRQPWAWAIIHGGKDVENRATNIAGGYRGPVAIHAAQATDFLGWRAFEAEALVAENPVGRIGTTDIRGVIIGVVDLVDVHDSVEHVHPAAGRMAYDIAPDSCSVWAERRGMHLVLASPRPLAEPIPYRGALGLRHLDEDTTARILAQIGAPA